jgi:hypothetical protein
MSNDWVPKIQVTRRIGGRLCRADNAGVIKMTSQDRETCVDAITRRYLSRLTRVRAGKLWRRYGPELARLAWVDPSPNRALDRPLDDLVKRWRA